MLAPRPFMLRTRVAIENQVLGILGVIPGICSHYGAFIVVHEVLGKIDDGTPCHPCKLLSSGVVRGPWIQPL